MKNIIIATFLLIVIQVEVLTQSADSVTITFRTYQPPTPVVFVPGEFNNWGPNVNGVISPGAPSQMEYDSTLGAWIKTYTFKIKDPTDTRRRMGDSIFQYKFNRGGTVDGWYSDPLNPEQNPADHNNSVLRMTRLFWIEFFAAESSGQVIGVSSGLVHANSDSITQIRLTTGLTPSSQLTNTEITSFYDRQKRILNYRLATPIARTSYIRLVAYNNLGDSVVYQKGGYVIRYRPVPSYAKHGVTLPSPISNDSTTFRIKIGGPEYEYVLLRIAQAGQPVATAEPIVMYHHTGPSEWWVNVKLPLGTYEYLYELSNGRQIHDPWGRQVGNYGTKFSTTAEGLTADNYVWNNVDFQRPPLEKLVIYELHVGEFTGGYYGIPSPGGTFRHLINLLPYFDSIGVNALELMPINDYGLIGQSGFSWGYDLNSFLAIEPTYGSPADFKELVDSAHGRGIAIIVDVVFNHLNETSSLWQMLPDEVANPFFKKCTDLRYNEDEMCYFKDVDHWTAETQLLIYTALKMWLDEYKVDGFRYDLTQGIGWNVNEPTKGILGWANRIHQEYGGSVYQIVEHLPESPALLYHSGITSGWHDSFRDRIFDEARFRNVPLTDFENLIIDLSAFPGNDTPASPSRYANRREPVNMTVNHDEQSLIFEMITFQNVPLDEAIKRDKLYATFMFTSLGIPMLWQGMEFSAPRGWYNDNQRLSYRPVEWNLYNLERGQSHLKYYRSLILQRIHNPALYNGNLRKLYRYTAEKILVWGFEDDSTNAKVMIVANLSGSDRNISNVPWLASGTWYDVFDQSIFSVTDTIVSSFYVPAYTARVFSNKSNSELGITSVDNTIPDLPKEFALEQNYPNPFNPVTTIKYQLPADVGQNRILTYNVTLKIYNILGQEVKTLVNEVQEVGYKSVEWNSTNNTGNLVSSGVYFYRIEATSISEPTKSFTQVRKMVILR